jgi:diphosphomevalonate decarboxylase
MSKPGRVVWRSPSNIAIVKYWGKKGIQLPANPSVSMTLSKCYTDTGVEYSDKKNSSGTQFSFLFHGKENIQFAERTGHFLETAIKELPELGHLYFKIDTLNSFPHSAGIASSASSISSLALCLCSISEQLTGRRDSEELFLRKASRLARVGSGSACRSVYGGWVLWGELPGIDNSSDEYAIPLQDGIARNFKTLYDSILVVNSGVKQVTSSQGHAKMENNPFKELKFNSGKLNAAALVDALRKGDKKRFIDISEYEAASLHSMFLLSDPPYILVKPETLQIIGMINKFRQETALEFCYTLDAGPNIHLLYHENIREKIVDFIKSELTQFCENGMWIDDMTGKGPELIQNQN